MPKLLEEVDFDAWIVVGREYNEDPVMPTLLPSSCEHVSGLTAFVFTKGGRFSLFPHARSMSRFYKNVWEAGEGDFFERLRKLIKDTSSRRVGVNSSENVALANGINYSLLAMLREAIGDLVEFVSAEKLAVDWLQLRTLRELELYKKLDWTAHTIISTVFSRDRIIPGRTTTDEIEWSLKELALELGLECWFGPDVDFQRKGLTSPRNTGLVLEGDLLHCDFGFHCCGLATDTQEMFYLPLRHEGDGLVSELEKVITRTNRVQDILARNFIEGITGNQLLKITLEEAREEGLQAMVYSHPVGYHGHGAGPTIGLWNNQKSVQGSGDFKIKNMSCYALELNCKSTIPGWAGQEVYGFLEETVAFKQGKIDYLDGRQEKLFLI